MQGSANAHFLHVPDGGRCLLLSGRHAIEQRRAGVGRVVDIQASGHACRQKGIQACVNSNKPENRNHSCHFGRCQGA